MKLQKQKEEWKNSIAVGNILSTLENIKNAIAENSLIKNQLYAIIGSFNDVNSFYRLNTIKYDDFTHEISRIRHNILELIDKIAVSDISNSNNSAQDTTAFVTVEDVKKLISEYIIPRIGSENKASVNHIFNKILVLSEKDGIASLKSYFNHRYFENISFEIWNNYKFYSLTDIEIVILNNMDLPHVNPQQIDNKTQIRIDIIKQIIEKTNCYIIHYGNFLPISNEFRNKLTYANSIFTLFSRVKELADFVNTYKIATL